MAYLTFAGYAPGSGASTSGPSFSLGLEKDLAAKDALIQALEQELEVAKKLAEENEAACKTTEEQTEEMHRDFRDYQKKKCVERNKVIADA